MAALGYTYCLEWNRTTSRLTSYSFTDNACQLALLCTHHYPDPLMSRAGGWRRWRAGESVLSSPDGRTLRWMTDNAHTQTFIVGSLEDLTRSIRVRVTLQFEQNQSRIYTVQCSIFITPFPFMFPSLSTFSLPYMSSTCWPPHLTSPP